MKKEYKTPLAEKLEFNYSENIVASGGNKGTLTDQATTAWWTCETRYTDVHSIDNSICGYI